MKTLLFLLGLLIYNSIQGQVITTFAGNGTNGSAGNGGIATSAQLSSPNSVCIDNIGNLFIADYANNIIRKVNPAGIISVYAGIQGNFTYSGDGGLSTSAHIGFPSGICSDNAGNILFTDPQNSVVRKINSAGIITTLAGIPGNGGFSGNGGLAINAKISNPNGICTDNVGNIFFAEFNNSIIRKINPAGIISTFAGIPGSFSYGGDGSLAINATLFNPTDIATDGNGNFYISDFSNNRIRKVNSLGIISTVAGNGVFGYTGDGAQATLAQFRNPYGLFADTNGNIYVSDNGNKVIRLINTSGIITTIIGTGTYGYTGDGGLATLATLSQPKGLCKDAVGNIYLADQGNNVIRQVNCPTAIITQQPSNYSLCSFGNANFSINVSSMANLQWQENTGNGWNDLTDNSIYAGTLTNIMTITNANNSMNGYQFRCKIINVCGITFSNVVILNVTTPSVPLINIITPTNIICQGSYVTFSAITTTAGTNPIFQWKKNGIPTGSNNSLYSDNSLINGDIISCVLVSNSNCITTTTALSNTITMTVNPLVTPTISISESLNNICFGTPVNFTSINFFGGLNPTYQWKKNGLNVGSNLSNYTDNSLNNGDNITCTIFSNESCISSSNAISNSITINVISSPIPSITITPSNTAICKGNLLTLTAQVINSGNNPVYQWKLNGAVTGANSSVLLSTNFNNNDIIICTLFSNINGSCLSSQNVNSNSIIALVFPKPVVALDKSKTLCEGSSRMLDAGNFNSFLWNDLSTNRNLAVNNLGTYYVTVTDNNGCLGSDTTTILSMSPAPNYFLPKDTSLCAFETLSIFCSSQFKDYLWNDNSKLPYLNINKPGIYKLLVTDSNNCKGTDVINIISKDCANGVYFPNAFTPNNDGINDIYKPLVYGSLYQYKFSIYNKYGQKVFESLDFTKGWNGNLNGSTQVNAAYVWICTYSLASGNPVTKKGSFLLLK